MSKELKNGLIIFIIDKKEYQQSHKNYKNDQKEFLKLRSTITKI